MKAVTLALLLALVSTSARADDTPRLVPADAVCYSPEERANIAKALTGKDARIKSLEEAPQGVPVGYVVLGLVVAVLAVGAGTAAGYAAGKSAPPE